MTIQQLHDAILGAYARVLRANAAQFPAVQPAGVTAMAWEEKLDVPDDGVAAYLEDKAEGLAMVGLYYGCDAFAPIRVVDRPEARRQSGRPNGPMNVRKRQLIVRAIGWRVEGRTN